jgi:hypothetical protein
MNRRLAPLFAVPILFLTVGCSQVGDAAKDIAGEAVSQAGSTAVAELQEQICTPLQDGQLSEQDQQVLSGLLTAADAAGMTTEFLAPLEEIAQSDGQLPGDAVAALLDECGVAPAPGNG